MKETLYRLVFSEQETHAERTYSAAASVDAFRGIGAIPHNFGRRGELTLIRVLDASDEKRLFFLDFDRQLAGYDILFSTLSAEWFDLEMDEKPTPENEKWSVKYTSKTYDLTALTLHLAEHGVVHRIRAPRKYCIGATIKNEMPKFPEWSANFYGTLAEAQSLARSLREKFGHVSSSDFSKVAMAVQPVGASSATN